MNVKSGFPLVFILLAFLLALAGCGPAPFSDLIGVNLIGGVDFSDPGWVADQSGTYMSFQSAGTAYNGSPAYRLEIWKGDRSR